MSIQFEGLIDSAFQTTEQEFRESVFSKGNSVLVPVWLISDIGKYNLEDEDFLEKQRPYIEKGFEIPEKIIPNIIDKPLYCHTLTNKLFFLREDLTPNVLSVLNKHCDSVSVSDVATRYSNNKKYDWTSANIEIGNIANEYEFLTSEEVEANMKLIESSIELMNVPSTALDYLDLFAKSDWSGKYNANLASLMLGISFAKLIPDFSEDAMRELVCMLVFKDIGYSRLAQGVIEFELLHGLVSHKIMSDANERNKVGSGLAPIVLESILKQHEFVDGSGALASRKHSLVVTKEQDCSVPIYAQISGICELFHYLHSTEENNSVAYALLKGMCTPVGNAKGKYEKSILKLFDDFYNLSLHTSDQPTKPDLDKKLQTVMHTVGQRWKFLKNDQRLPDFEKVKKILYQDETMDAADRITKVIYILRALSNIDNGLSAILFQICPYPPEFVQSPLQ